MVGRLILTPVLAVFLTVTWPSAAPPLAKARVERSAQARQDFGVSGLEVRSVKVLDVGRLNAAVRQAAGKGEDWVRDAVLVALRFTGTGLKGHTKIIRVHTPPERRDAAVITVSESGYLDDATGGERWRLWLKKAPDGTWIIRRALWAWLCERPGHRFYSAEPCP